MANVLVDEQSLTNIANSIRTKAGVETTYRPGDMATAITNIPSTINLSDGIKFRGSTIQNFNNYKLNGTNCTDFGGVFYDCPNLTTIPSIDTSQGANFSSMFYDCPSLTTIPLLDFSQGTNFGYMFSDCSNLTTIPLLNTSKGDSFQYMFSGCSSLTTIPLLNTSKGTIFQYMFRNCTSLTTIPSLDFSKGWSLSYLFSGCTSLTTLPLLDFSSATSFSNMFTSCTKLTTLGGFKDLGEAFSTTTSQNGYVLNLVPCTNLTHDSLINVINNLYDIKTKGCKNQRLNIGSTNLAKLTAEEIAIATNKGWNVT